MSLLNAVPTQSKWEKQVGAAVKTWGKFTEAELMRLEGHEQKLVLLIEQRYGIAHEAAARQVKEFFEKHSSCTCCK